VAAADDVARAIVEARASAPGKTVLACFMSARGAPQALAPVPCYVFPESAATALARATQYGAWRRTPVLEPVHFTDVLPDEARGVVRDALARGGGWLTPIEAQRMLEAYSIPVARAAVAATEDESVAVARSIGFPVVMKAVGPTIVHKTEDAGIKLDLGGEADVRDAFRDLTGRLGPRLTGVLVQEMVRAGVEAMIGAVNEPTFGPVLACGTGGVLVDVLSDTSFRLPPLTAADAEQMVDELKCAVLLRGYRGAPPADRAALVDALLRVSALVEACPEIQEMDINPVKVLQRGVRAVDVRIRVERLAVRPPSRRIVY
jgi:acyl-CoA synthetase (NDP forming)